MAIYLIGWPYCMLMRWPECHSELIIFVISHHNITLINIQHKPKLIPILRFPGIVIVCNA